jgi:hypothetical protein
VPEAAPTVDHLAALFVAQQYGRQEPSTETLTQVAENWQALGPRLWRRWLGRIIDAPKSKPPSAG